MTDFPSEHARPTAPEAPQSTGPDGPPPLDRRGFLRALSGSALTLVAGGLTITLSGCQGGGGNSPYVGGIGFGSSSVVFTSASPPSPPAFSSSTFPSSSSSSSATAHAVARAHLGLNTRF
ncbi:MAG: hypothetical protein JO250_12080 [Armatimonadetes bacterium]|nr:hypothetical protein [Armatimonadota bacterium]